jgi:hypothetical protein
VAVVVVVVFCSSSINGSNINSNSNNHGIFSSSFNRISAVVIVVAVTEEIELKV